MPLCFGVLSILQLFPPPHFSSSLGVSFSFPPLSDLSELLRCCPLAFFCSLPLFNLRFLVSRYWLRFCHICFLSVSVFVSTVFIFPSVFIIFFLPPPPVPCTLNKTVIHFLLPVPSVFHPPRHVLSDLSVFFFLLSFFFRGFVCISFYTTFHFPPSMK